MARRKNDWEGLMFDDLVGTYQAPAADVDSQPISRVVVVDAEYAEPCHECGDQPALHIMNFKNKAANPNNVYICCSHCSACDGEFYESREVALAEWNRQNAGSKRRDRSVKDDYDFIKEIMDDMKIPD